ncbi:MAG: GNAT family N-acetyltransferase [Lachnospiraceae bacterium]|jgi:ribosomal protein S18 acetylase RimI-like enzyme|nr:GNAT family N-acetyltransferase [Lachnospiraceae bacterium]
MIREITCHDIPECVNVICASFLTVADEMGFTRENAPRFTAFATTAERLTYQLEHDHHPMYAYQEADRIVGYYSLALQKDHECELNNLCVLPAYRHRRIGEKLLDDACEKAQALGCIKLNIGIVEENTLLRHWYETMGFRHIGTQKFDFFPFTCGYMEKNL